MGHGSINTVLHGDALPVEAVDGTVCEEIGASDASVTPQSHPRASRDLSSRNHAPVTAASLLRAQRRRDMLAAIEEWRRADCIERAWWRSTARVAIAEFRRLHLRPEAAAFRAAVARGRP